MSFWDLLLGETPREHVRAELTSDYCIREHVETGEQQKHENGWKILPRIDRAVPDGMMAPQYTKEILSSGTGRMMAQCGA